MKALFYVRVSSKEQEKEEFSLDAQEKLGLDYAKRKGLEIIKTWKVSESAWREERISFNQMVEYAKKILRFSISFFRDGFFLTALSCRFDLSGE